LEANYFTILYWFCHTSTWIRHRRTHVPHPEPPPTSFLPSLRVIPVHQPQASCIEPWLAILFLYDIIHVSMTFPQTIPPSPSPTESKRQFCTSGLQSQTFSELTFPAWETWVRDLNRESDFLAACRSSASVLILMVGGCSQRVLAMTALWLPHLPVSL